MSDGGSDDAVYGEVPKRAKLTAEVCHDSGQVIATSHDLGPQKVAGSSDARKWDPLFQGNLGW